MDFHYKDIVPWGRSFDEYLDMFNLSENDLVRNIVGVGDGPASFNARDAPARHANGLGGSGLPVFGSRIAPADSGDLRECHRTSPSKRR